MSVIRTEISKKYNNIKRFEVFTTEKYKLPLYSFSVVDKDGKKLVLKYYILSQDLSKIIQGNKDRPIEVYMTKQNSSIPFGHLDYILYNNETYLSDQLIARSSNLIGWNVDMESLIMDIQNATIAEELNYQEAVRNFTEYKVQCKHSMVTNNDKLVYAVKKGYPFLDEYYIEGLIRTVMDNAIIEFELPYNELKFVNEEKMKAVNEAFDFIEEVVRDYRKEFNKNNGNLSPKEEIKRTEEEIMNEQTNNIIAEFEQSMMHYDNIKNNFNASNLHLFVNKMETALIGEIQKVRNDFPASWIRERLLQEACALQYSNNDRRLMVKDARKVNQKSPGTYNLGDELLTMFFMRHIGSQDATYEHKDNHNNRSYFPILQGKTQVNGLPEYSGLLTREKYNNILRQNTIILFPGFTPDQITREHFTIVRNYCETKL